MFRIWRAPANRQLCRTLMTQAANLEQQLKASEAQLALVQIPGAGRGLIAATDIPQGATVLLEFPMILHPSPHAIDKACYHCLRPLAQQRLQQAAQRVPAGQGATSAVRFCSQACLEAAEAEYFKVERQCDWGPLQDVCREAGEKLPLMLARLACTHITQLQQPGEEVISDREVCEGRGCYPRGNPLQDLNMLCYANTPSPPPAWRHQHSLLLSALQGCMVLVQGLSSPAVTPKGVSWSSKLSELFPLQWYCGVMARLHINIFRIDTVPALPTLDRSALLSAAAGLLSSPDSPSHTTGSGAFLLASMLNHSCEPNLEVTFPQNNAAVAFTAARDIPRGEQLCISYVDSELGHRNRRDALRFGYGFECSCPKCREGR